MYAFVDPDCLQSISKTTFVRLDGFKNPFEG